MLKCKMIEVMKEEYLISHFQITMILIASEKHRRHLVLSSLMMT